MNTVYAMFYIVVCIFANSTFLFSNINSYIFEFSKTTTNNGVVVDSVSGNLFSNQEKLFVEILYPVKQKFISEFDKTIIYYLEDNRALSFPGPPTYFPFYNFLISCTIEDFGLSSTGFQLDSTQIQNDIMLTFWSPPAHLSEQIQKVKMHIENNKIIQVDTYGIAGVLLSSVQFSEFVMIENYNLPMVIKINEIRSKDNILTKLIRLANLDLNKDISIHALKFKIPIDVKIEDMDF